MYIRVERYVFRYKVQSTLAPVFLLGHCHHLRLGMYGKCRKRTHLCQESSASVGAHHYGSDHPSGCIYLGDNTPLLVLRLKIDVRFQER